MIRYSKQVAQLTAIAAAAVLAAPAFAATEVNANAEFDTTYLNKSQDQFSQGGRIEVNITGKTKVGDGYVAGKGTAILGHNGGASTDDSWVEGGVGAFSVRLGRFEATALASTPADVLVVGRVGYMGDQLRGRNIGGQDSYVAGAPAGIAGQPHFTFNGDFGGGIGLEVGVVEENTGTNVSCVTAAPVPPALTGVTTCSKTSKFGLRPVLKIAAGPVSAAVGFEKSGLPNSKLGVAGTGAFDLGGGASVGLNVASQGKDSNSGQTSTATGFGAFGTFGPVTAAVQAGKDHFGNKGNYAYVTAGMPFFATPAMFYIGVSTGKTPSGVAGGGSTKETGIRARVHYDF